MLKENEVVIGVSKYDFHNEDGERIKGNSLFVLGENIESDNFKGHRIAKYSVTDEIVKNIETYPAICDIQYSIGITASGQSTLNIESLKFKKGISLKWCLKSTRMK